MRKNILFLAALVCLASCDKESGSQPTPTPTPDPETPASVELIVTAAPGQSDFIKQTFEFSVGTAKVTVNGSDMKNVTSQTNFPNFKKKVINSISVMPVEHAPEPEFYTISLGTILKGQTVECTKRTATMVQSRTSVQTFDLYDGGIVLINGKEVIMDKSEVKLHFGINNTDEAIQSFCNKSLNPGFLVSYFYPKQ